MDLTQIIYASLLATAIWYGGPDWRLSALCVVNFAGTMMLAASPISVGVLDLLTVAALISVGTWRGYALAAIFALLVPIYPVGIYFEWPSHATYAIVDALCSLTFGVLASGNGGYRAKRRDKSRTNGGRRSGVSAFVASRCGPSGHHPPHTQVHKPKLGATVCNMSGAGNRATD